jgi:hypothetical protein
MHDARDFTCGLTEQAGHLSGARKIGVQLFVLAAQ